LSHHPEVLLKHRTACSIPHFRYQCGSWHSPTPGQWCGALYMLSCQQSVL